MILISFLLVFLQKGAIQIASQFNLNDYASNIITGIILFFILGSEFFINYRIILRGGKEAGQMSSDQIVQLIQSAIQFGTVILFGAMGEILTEKSGNLNLGVPGHHVSGRYCGPGGLLLLRVQQSRPHPAVCLSGDLSVWRRSLASALGGLLYSFLTITLRANQNVTGLTLTIFGGGVANFFGGALNTMAGGVGQISVAATSAVYRATIPGLSDLGRPGPAAVQLWLHGVSGHRAGRGAAAVPQPHPDGPEPAGRG